MTDLHKNLCLDPLVTTVNVIGDSYTFLITREAFFGASRFEDFATGLRISRARLAERLKHLVAAGIFEKRLYSKTSKRYEYRFTQKGLSLYQIAIPLLEWGDTWRPRKNGVVLHHKLCGNPVIQKTICCACTEEVKYEDILWPSSPVLISSEKRSSNVRGWRKTSLMTDVSDRHDSAAQTLNAVGDRWSILVMYLALHGNFRFKDALSGLGVADNILSNRLKHLVEQKLLVRRTEHNQQIYVPTKSGIALLPVMLAQRMWASKWQSHEGGQCPGPHHATCTTSLTTKCVCIHCEHPIHPSDVNVHVAEKF